MPAFTAVVPDKNISKAGVAGLFSNDCQAMNVLRARYYGCYGVRHCGDDDRYASCHSCGDGYVLSTRGHRSSCSRGKVFDSNFGKTGNKDGNS